MKANVGAIDGFFRILLFVIAILFAVLGGENSWIWLIPTSILFVTAALSWCPLYDMFGISTNKDTPQAH